MKLLEVRWERYAVVLKPVNPWPPCQELADVTESDASRMLYEVCCEAVGSRATWEVSEDWGKVYIKVPVDEGKARAIVSEFLRRCRELASRRAAIASAFGDPRPSVQEQETDEAPVPWHQERSVEEEEERFRAELDAMLSRRGKGV